MSSKVLLKVKFGILPHFISANLKSPHRKNVHGRIVSRSSTVQRKHHKAHPIRIRSIRHKNLYLSRKAKLILDNANVKELHDSEGSQYFNYMRQRAIEGANNQAKVEVAQARMTGDIGEREKIGLTRQRVAQIDAETAISETIRKKEKATAEAEFTKRQAELDMEIQIAQITARRGAESRDAELQKEVETKKAETEYARLQASDLTKTRIAREKMAQQADAELYAAKKKADAELYSQQKIAEATQLSMKVEADMVLYAKHKEAEGIQAVYQAQYDGFVKLKDALGSDDTLMKFLMLEKGLFLDLAHANANAIQGLNPKINIWNTGNPSIIAPLISRFTSWW
jgi:flotillin